MSFTPISNTAPQYEENGIAASGFYIKLYESGTTTPTAMATDSTGATLLDKCQLDTEGYPINGSGSVFIPHINVEYKIALFRNKDDANNNNLANAAWDVDGLFPVSTGSSIGTDFDQVPLNTNIVYPVATVADLRLLEPTVDGQQFNLLEYNAGAGLGGGALYYDASDTTSADDGGSVFVTVTGKRIRRKLNGYITPEMFGSLLSGADDSTILSNMISTGKNIEINSGIFGVKEYSGSTSFNLHVNKNAKLLFLTPDGLGSSYNSINSTADDVKITIDGIIDGNDTGITGIRLTGNDCAVLINGKATGFSIKSGSASSVSVAIFEGDNAKFYGDSDGYLRNSVSFEDIPAAPRMFTVQGTADNWECGDITTYDATDVLVIGGSTGRGSHGVITDYRTLDNTVYQLGGSCTGKSIVHIDGEDECLVCEGDYVLTGGLIVRGYCLAPLGIENSGDVSIGFIDWDDEDKTRTSDGEYSGGIFRTRSSNSSSGQLAIGSIRAKYTGTTLTSCGTGSASRLICKDVDVLFRYSALNTNLNLNSWMSISAFGSFNIADWSVRIYDATDTLTAATIFRGQCSASVSGSSSWDNIKVYTTFTAGFGDHKFRFSNLAQELIETSGIAWQSSIPSAEESNLFDSGSNDLAEASPTSGYWKAGKLLFRRNIGAEPTATSKNIMWACVASGSPGSWVSVKGTVEDD